MANNAIPYGATGLCVYAFAVVIVAGVIWGLMKLFRRK